MQNHYCFFQFRIFAFILLCFLSINSFSENKYNIIPYPQQLLPQSGEFVFNSNTRILCNLKQPEILKLARQFAAQLNLVSGMNLNVDELSGADTTNVIFFQNLTNAENTESYRLLISPKTIRIESGSANGFFYGLQSLYQLMPPEVYSKKFEGLKKWFVPSVQIADMPRFSYRGLHLDVCRHFFPISFVKKYIDAMAIHKLNYFHWHLTDDQGWRIEIKKYPRLTKVGSKRAETLVGYYYSRYPQQFDALPHQGFYTQDEAREIVAYAAERFITVIPEIEMPGHAVAALSSYPYLSCRRDSTLQVATRWGVFPDIYCPRDTTFRFLENVLTEIMAIFPSKYIHIGGDECPKERWKACPDCQAKIKKEGLKDENGLQSYFVHRIESFLNSKGRKIIGWDEILDGGLAPNATVMSWRGTRGGIAAAKAGHDVIMTPGATCYFDHYQADPVTEPVSIGGYLPLSMVYNYEPVPAELNASEAKYIWGAQANLWTEYISTTEHAEHMAFPRVSAMAEVLWSNKTNCNWDSFRKRMPTEFERYKNLGIQASQAFYNIQFSATPTQDHKLQIALSCDCADARIEFEIKGKIVTYKQPFILTETSDISARAIINGKPVGKSITKKFIVSKLTGMNYSQNIVNTWYRGDSNTALTDGIPGNTVSYTQWVGFGRGKDSEIIFDLKSSTTLQHCSVGLLHTSALCVVLPANMRIFGSMNGANYTLLAESKLPVSKSAIWEMSRPEVAFAPTSLRFLKIELKSGGDCPSDSPDRMDGSMMFIDEIAAW